MSLVGAAAAFLTGFLGSNTTLLFSLRDQKDELSDLEERFRSCINEKGNRRQKSKIISFHETKPTLLLGWFSIGLLSATAPSIFSCLMFSKVVARDSARGYAADVFSIDTDHSGLNKCLQDDPLYQKLKAVLVELRP